MRNWRLQAVFGLCMLVVLAVWVLHPAGDWRLSGWWSTNVLSRLIPVERVLNAGTLAMDGSPLPPSTDKVRIDGRFYSSKPPLPTLFYVPVSGLLQWAGTPLVSYPEVHVVVLAAVFSLAPYVLACLWALTRTPAGLAGYVLALALGLGSLPPLYAVGVGNHAMAAAALLTGYLVLEKGRRLWLAGLLLGLAGAAEHTAWLSGAALGMVSWRREGKVLLLGAAAPVLLTLGYYVWFSGVPVPFYLQHVLYDYPGSMYEVAAGVGTVLGDAGWHLRYFFFLTIGLNGLVSNAPVLAIACLGLGRAGLLPRALAAAAAGVLAFVSLATFEGGSGSLGIRWFVHFTPVLLYALLPLGVERLRELFPDWWRFAALQAVLFGLVVSVLLLLGGGQPWTRCEMDPRGFPLACAGAGSCVFGLQGNIFGCQL